MLLISLYLLSIVTANLAVTWFGPSVSILNAFLFIALDLTSRDALHERWERRHLWRNMLALIGTGSVLSALLNVHALPIALASFVAFVLSGVADTLVYSAMHRYPKIAKMNGSNAVSMAIDSFVFPVLAFGWPPLWGVVIGQYAAKMLGGFVWSIILSCPVSAPSLTALHE